LNINQGFGVCVCACGYTYLHIYRSNVNEKKVA